MPRLIPIGMISSINISCFGFVQPISHRTESVLGLRLSISFLSFSHPLLSSVNLLYGHSQKELCDLHDSKSSSDISLTAPVAASTQ